MASGPAVDLCLVAARRPDLLQRTLETFKANLFSNIKIERVLVNIDPIFGPESDGAATADVVKSFFPKAETAMPSEPGFCEAVRSLWKRSTAPYLFHLEDDWELNEKIDSDIFRLFDDKTIAQVSLDCEIKKWNFDKKGEFHFVRRTSRVLFGLIERKHRFPQFTTSPSFLDGAFARRVAERLDPKFDPEKQMFSKINPGLEAFLAKRRNRFLRASQGYLISDTGREWRAKRGIIKRVHNAVSDWSTSPADATEGSERLGLQ